MQLLHARILSVYRLIFASLALCPVALMAQAEPIKKPLTAPPSPAPAVRGAPSNIEAYHQTPPGDDSLANIPLSYEFTEIGLTLKLPPRWTPLSSSSIEVMNRMVRSKAPDYKFTYIGGFERDHSLTSPTADTYPTYILLQKTPFQNGMTPQVLHEMFPLLQPRPQPEIGKAPTPPASGLIYLDPTEPAIVVCGSTPSPGTEATSTIVRAYEIVTSPNLIGVNVYCRGDAGRLIFAEVEQILSGMVLSKDVLPPGSWIGDLSKLAIPVNK